MLREYKPSASQRFRCGVRLRQDLSIAGRRGAKIKMYGPRTRASLGTAILDRLRHSPAMVLITYLPEVEPPWKQNASVAILARRHGNLDQMVRCG